MYRTSTRTGRERKLSKRKQKLKNEDDKNASSVVSLSEDKKAELRERARLLARTLSRLQEDGQGESESMLSRPSGSEDIAGPSAKSHDQRESKSIKKKKKRKPWREERVKSTPAKKQHEKSRSATPSVEKADDSYVLGCLLKSAGVRCAMNHDDLISDEPSGYLVEKEADAVATRAAKSIRR
ncbi:hypothetical protein OSTOST_08271, partial [Ostertagia ostertagi]